MACACGECGARIPSPLSRTRARWPRGLSSRPLTNGTKCGLAPSPKGHFGPTLPAISAILPRRAEPEKRRDINESWHHGWGGKSRKNVTAPLWRLQQHLSFLSSALWSVSPFLTTLQNHIEWHSAHDRHHASLLSGAHRVLHSRARPFSPPHQGPPRSPALRQCASSRETNDEATRKCKKWNDITIAFR